MNIKSNITFYYDEDSLNKIGNVPFFLDGTNPDLEKIKKYLSRDISSSDYLISYLDKFESDDIFEYIKKAKLNNKSIGYIIVCKEEQLSLRDWDVIYKLEELGFSKNEIVIISAELDHSVFGEYTSISSNLIFGEFLHKYRTLIPDSFFDKNLNSLKNKKIISSARKFNPIRENFYINFDKNYSHLQNNNNSFRYYGLIPNCKTDTDTSGNEYKKFNNVNYSHDIVSTDAMMNREEYFYNTLLEEYNNYYFSVVHETLPKGCFSEDSMYIDYNMLYPNYPSKLQAGEKVLLPMTTKGIFFVSSLPNIEKHLNDIGVETFDGLFGISYDSLDYDNRNKKILEICDTINKMSFEDISDLYNSISIQQKIKSNYEFVLYWKNQENIKNEYLKEIETLKNLK